MSDLISRQDAIEGVKELFACADIGNDECDITYMLENLPSADRPTVDKEYLIDLIQEAVYDGEACAKLIDLVDRPTGEWTTEQVAEMLANLFGDECACNLSGIDEWLPLACKYADTQCPDPKEKHGCWMQFLIQGGGTSE